MTSDKTAEPKTTWSVCWTLTKLCLREIQYNTVHKGICRNSWIILSYCFSISWEGRGVAQCKRNKKSRLYISLFGSAVIWEYRDEELLNMRQICDLPPSSYFKISKIITKISLFCWIVQPSALYAVILKCMFLLPT